MVLQTLLYFIYRDQPHPPGQQGIFNHVGVAMLGILPFALMFLVTSIAMLRERSSGTLERLFTTRIRKMDLLGGYGSAFSLTALRRQPYCARSRSGSSASPSRATSAGSC